MVEAFPETRETCVLCLLTNRMRCTGLNSLPGATPLKWQAATLRVLWTGLFSFGLLLAVGVAAYAQESAPPATPGAAPAPVTAAAPVAPVVATPVVAASSAGGPWAPDPLGFTRGNRFPQQIGFYYSWVKFIPVLLLFLTWTYYSNWVQEDSHGLRIRTGYWNSLMLLGGTLGFLGALTVPLPFLGLGTALLTIGFPLGMYVVERNQAVPESARVLTQRHIAEWSRRQLSKIGIHLGTREEVEKASGPPIVFVGKTSTGKRDDKTSRAVEQSKGYLAARELVYDSIMRRCTDIHLEPKEDELAVRLRIDGVMYPTEPFDRAIGDAIVNIFKVLSAMDITERRRPQDGSFGALMESREIDFRVATQGTRFGEKMSLRILDQSNSVKSLENLGMRKQMQEAIEKIIHQPHGLFLSCGPTGAGKSTTLYTALNALDANEMNIITIEDPVEYKMETVNQIEINTKSGQTFAGSLRSVLRQDPDVVMIGEIRDEETAKVCCQAANTGHMVFSTIHANDSITALFRLIDLGVEPFMLSSSISAILAQRLGRKLCPHCKQSYKPNPEFLKQAGLSAEKVKELYRAKENKGAEGCTHCSGLGYMGRIGVFELLVVNERMREMIRETEAMSAIRAEARKAGMLTMMEEGVRLVVRGVTSVEEIVRVVK